jgi:hypothetical protein
MARYLITYLDTCDEEITADYIELVSSHYTAYQDSKPVAYIPAGNVRSIIRQDDTEPTGH